MKDKELFCITYVKEDGTISDKAFKFKGEQARRVLKHIENGTLVLEWSEPRPIILALVSGDYQFGGRFNPSEVE